ncbi:MAG: 30S ribosomal protein S20 [Minisyncoccia bacterium]
MPIKKSAKKELRKNEKRRIRNLFWKRKIKNLEKEIKNLVLENKIEEAKKILPEFYKIIDKAAKNNVLKKNTASRKKSKIVKLINSKTKS